MVLVVFVHASVRVVESATRIMVVVLPYLTGECDDYMFCFSHGGDNDDGKYCLLWRSFPARQLRTLDSVELKRVGLADASSSGSLGFASRSL